MPLKGQAERAHPQAADWVLGTLGPDETIAFRLHLKGCPHCQAAVAEFGQLGQLLQHLPPAAEPPPELQARTIASILAAAEDWDRTQVHQVPAGLAAAEDQAATEIRQVPPAAADESSGGMAKVIRFPRWRSRTGLLTLASAVAAAVLAALLIVPGLGPPKAAFAFQLVSAPRSGQAASGTAMARQDSSGSWNVTLTVHHLKRLGPNQWYECWYVSRDGRQAVAAGTFIVSPSGSGTFTMTSSADPRNFQTMEITAQSPGNGALAPVVILSGKAKKL
jgi:Anti-sigma-K factor rskA/Putative zinc-finger